MSGFDAAVKLLRDRDVACERWANGLRAELSNAQAEVDRITAEIATHEAARPNYAAAIAVLEGQSVE